MHRIAIFASGEGTNAEAIVCHFQVHHPNTVFSIWSNRSDAGVLRRAEKLNVSTFTFTNEAINGIELVEKIVNWGPDLIVLAGFLRKIPETMVKRYVGRIINIHPSLLPKYGGEGMYGMRVHKAVKQAGETETGITIHLVDEEYDRGKILYQHRILVWPEQTAEEISKEVKALEQAWYPVVIKNYLQTITGIN